MSQRNEHLDLIINELERYGLRGEVSDRGKHLEVAWTTPHGRRFVIAARTPSDWRAGLNTRSEVRKLLKADNMQVKHISELSYQKAMSLPKHVMPTEHVLQQDVIVLTDMVFELQSHISVLQQQNQMLQDKINSIRVISKVEFGVVEDSNELVDIINSIVDQGEVEPPLPFRKGTTQAKIYDVLTDQFKSVYDIVDLCKVDKKYVATTLSKAKKLGFVEHGLRGMYRRKKP